MANWDGEERRGVTKDHDILITVANDVKHMVDWTKTHTKEDDDRHKENIVKFDKMELTLDGLKQFKWKSTAVVGSVLIMVDLAIKWFNK